MNKFTIDGLTLQDILDRLPEIADNRARLMGYLRHVTQYALDCENKLGEIDSINHRMNKPPYGYRFTEGRWYVWYNYGDYAWSAWNTEDEAATEAQRLNTESESAS